VATDGTDFKHIYSFTAGGDGAIPFGLISSGNTLYGASQTGGAYSVFSVDVSGSGFSNLFTLPAVSTPLILSGNTFYVGGNTNLFSVRTDGTGLVTLHSFPPNSSVSGLTLSGDTLYGTTQFGGTWNNGTIFSLSTDGSMFTTLYNFTPYNWDPSQNQTNSDGVYPTGVIVSGNSLYGTAQYGGPFGGAQCSKSRYRHL
jgi:uncharacterized repeat protein (TIGR03803 family)